MSREFDATVPQYVEAAAGIDLFGVTNWTILMWFRCANGAATGDDMTLFARYDFAGSDGYQWAAQLRADGTFRFFFVDNFFQLLDSSTSYDDDAWHLAVIRFGAHDAVGANALELRIDGVDAYNGLSFSDAHVVSAPMRLGSGGSSLVEQPYTGLVSRPAVFLGVTLDDATVDAYLTADPTGADFWTIAAINELVDYGGFTTLTNHGSTYNASEPFSSGTLFTKGLSGTITSAGTVTKKTARGLAGSITPAGVVTKRPARTLTGTVTSAATLLKRLARSLTGTATSAGTVTKRTVRTVTGTATSAGSVTKQTNRALAGTVTSAGAVATVKTKLVGLTGTIASAGSLLKQTARSLTGTVAPTGATTKQTRRSLAGAVTPTGTLATLKASLKALTGTIASAGVLTRQTGKALSGTAPSVGTVTRAVSRPLAGAVTSTGTLTRQTRRGLAGVLAPVGSLVRRITKVLAGLIGSSGNLSYHSAGSGGDTGVGVPPRHLFISLGRTRAFQAHRRRSFKAES